MSEQYFAGSTSQTVDVFIKDSSSTTGAGLAGLVFNSASLTAYYRKGATGAATAITLATQTVGGAYSSGGFVEIQATNMIGIYRLDIPNAAIDTSGFVTLYLYGATNMMPTAQRIDCRAPTVKLEATTHTGAVIPTVTTLTGHTAQTGDSFARLGAPTGASVSADILEVALYIDTEVGAILLDTGTTLPATLATIEGKIDTVDTVVDLIVVDTGTTLPATLATAANLSTLDGKVDTAQSDLDIITGIDGVVLQAATQASVDAIQADTNELQVDDVPGLIAALNDIAATDVLTTQMTEAYAADGVDPTLAQSLFLVQQTLTEFAIVGTALTVKKVDGSTTAAVLTLDDATNPTSATRTT